MALGVEGRKMKALSLIQPWAELIVSGHKTVELRTWPTRFRGEFLIHASKAGSNKRLLACGPEYFAKYFPSVKIDWNKLDFGKIVGKAILKEVKTYENADTLEKDSSLHFAPAAYDEFPVFGFLLKDAARFQTPIPVRGALNFWEYKGAAQ
jgi:hypothetical protein